MSKVKFSLSEKNPEQSKYVRFDYCFDKKRVFKYHWNMTENKTNIPKASV